MTQATNRASETAITPEEAARTGEVAAADVLGVRVAATSLEAALDAIDEWIVTGARRYACVTDMRGVIASRRDETLRGALTGARLVLPGRYLVARCVRRGGAADAEVISARDLLFACCRRSMASGYRHFFYGPTETAVRKLVGRLRRRFPGLVIAGACAPGAATAHGDDAATARRIDEAEPDIVWVGLGTPREECWMASQLDRLPSTVMVGIGLAYEVRLPHLARWLSLWRAWHLMHAQPAVPPEPGKQPSGDGRASGPAGWKTAIGAWGPGGGVR